MPLSSVDELTLRVNGTTEEEETNTGTVSSGQHRHDPMDFSHLTHRLLLIRLLPSAKFCRHLPRQIAVLDIYL